MVHQMHNSLKKLKRFFFVFQNMDKEWLTPEAEVLSHHLPTHQKGLGEKLLWVNHINTDQLHER